MAKFASGRFVPKNPQKYVGKSAGQIMFRSSWELAFMKWLDSNNAVLRWGSEELAIPYVSPLDGRVHRYFPDMVIMYLDTTGQVRKEIIEIKPYKESVATPRMSPRDAQALMVNEAKWKYASDWANRNGAVFRVLTERTLFVNRISKQKKAMGTSV
jgi:hypothetical protein